MISKLKFYHLKENEMYEVNGLRINQKTVECFPKDNRFSFITFEEDEGILMQSTGLKDKNGVEIFEGDVVKYDPTPNPFFRNTNFEILQARTGEWRIESIRGGLVLGFANHKVEVIGTKFEHPHLLKE